MIQIKRIILFLSPELWVSALRSQCLEILKWWEILLVYGVTILSAI